VSCGLLLGEDVIPVASHPARSPATREPCRREARLTFLPNTTYGPALLAALQRAKQEIVVAMFQCVPGPEAGQRATQVAQALIAAATRGVRVIVILDQPPEGDSLEAPNHPVAAQLRRQGITVGFDAPGRMLHTKLVVIDRRVVFLGSHNLTQSALRSNQEASVRIDSPRLARQALASLARLVPAPGPP